MTWPEAGAILGQGGVGVMPTDTLYGIVGSAFSKKAVTRIYRARKRNPKKPMIILLASSRDARRFGVKLGSKEKKVLRNLWPGKVSVVLPCPSRKFSYLHRGTKTLAFRVPAKKNLRALLARTGPLVAPSANWEGKPPARTLAEAKKYFGDAVDFYLNGGRPVSLPSTLVKLNNKGEITLLRPGATKLRGRTS